MTDAEIKVILERELPDLISQDAAIRDFILHTVSNYYAGKSETESKFDRVLARLDRDSAEQKLQWQEQSRLNNQILANIQNLREVQARNSEEQKLQWQEQSRLNDRVLADIQNLREVQTRNSEEQRLQWQEQRLQWHEQKLQWQEQSRINQELLREINSLERRFNNKFDSTVGALGARWGVNTEASFRNALKGILEDSFGVEVINLNEFDRDGEVFGRPDQVEIDLILKNGLVILCEIKSSMSKSDMYIFDRKVTFYEKHHQRTVDRKLVISPMVDSRALPVAENLGIEIYVTTQVKGN